MCSQQSNLSSSGEPSPHNHVPSFCVSLSPIQNLSSSFSIFSLRFSCRKDWTGSVDGKNNMFSVWEIMLTDAETSGCDGTKPVSCVNLQQCDIPAPLCCLCEPDLLLDVGNHLWPFPIVNYYRRNNSTVFQSSSSLLDSLNMAELRIDQRLESQFESESSYRFGICHCLFHHHQRLQTCKKSKIRHLLVFTKAGQVFCTSVDVFSSRSPSVMKEDKKISLSPGLFLIW